MSLQRRFGTVEAVTVEETMLQSDAGIGGRRNIFLHQLLMRFLSHSGKKSDAQTGKHITVHNLVKYDQGT